MKEGWEKKNYEHALRAASRRGACGTKAAMSYDTQMQRRILRSVQVQVSSVRRLPHAQPLVARPTPADTDFIPPLLVLLVPSKVHDVTSTEFTNLQYPESRLASIR